MSQSHFIAAVEELVETRAERWWVWLIVCSDELEGVGPDLVVVGLVELCFEE